MTRQYEASYELPMRGIVVRRKAFVRLIAYSMVFLHLALVIAGIHLQSPTRDEPVHLNAGIGILLTGRTDYNPGNTPLVNICAAFPVRCLYPQTDLHLVNGHWVISSAPNDLPKIFTVARLGCLIFTALGAWVCYQWGARLHGDWAGLVSLSLWCFSPSIIAAAQLITADAAAAATGILAAYAFWKWSSLPNFRSMWQAGLCCGCALLSKFALVIIVPLMFVTWLLCLSFGRAYGLWQAMTQALQFVIIVVIGVLILNCGYAFEGSFLPMRSYVAFTEDALGVLPSGPWEELPVPLPKNYIKGMHEIQQVLRGQHGSYLAGEWRESGWWYYYIYGLAVKLPVGTLGLLAIAFVVTLVRRKADWAAELFVVLPAVGFLAFVSYFSNMSHHFRYALPFLPFCFVFAGRTTWCFTDCSLRIRQIVVVCLVSTICASLWNWPHSLSFFNVLAGGSPGGRYHMIDSGLDWGQDLMYLERWIDQHPEAKPLNLVYFGSIDPRLLGIKYCLPKPSCKDLPTGWYAISVNFVMGRESSAPDGLGGLVSVGRNDYTCFQEIEPVARIGYSIDIYHVPQQKISVEKSRQSMDNAP